MSTDYPAGTVAVATVRGIQGVRVMRCGGNGPPYWFTPEYQGDILGAELQWRLHPDSEVTDIRPLVVLDPEDLAVKEFVRMHTNDTPGNRTCASSRPVAAQIEAQTKPPRIPEPGLWGVVSAREVNAIGDRDWVHLPTGAWASLGGSRLSTWDNLVDPVLIREGVQS